MVVARKFEHDSSRENHVLRTGLNARWTTARHSQRLRRVVLRYKESAAVVKWHYKRVEPEIAQE